MMIYEDFNVMGLISILKGGGLNYDDICRFLCDGININ